MPSLRPAGGSRRPLLIGLTALSLCAVGLSWPGSAQATPTVATPTVATPTVATPTVATPTVATPASSQPVFSHAVVVDQQRSGFEPGIQIDSADRLYTSVPYGFSNTQSFLWSSEDHGNSYQLIPASVGTGKAETCAGGGDSELALDKKDNLFFSDLQGLTNLSNSVTTDHGRSFSASCTSAPNVPVDRMWYAVHGSLGDPDFAIYEEYDDVEGGLDPANPTTNQLVETVSHDGINFAPVVNNNLTDPGCIGGGVLNCVTNDEGIPGNQLLSKDGKTLYIAHTSADSNKVAVSIGALSTNAAGVTSAAWKTVQVNADLCPDKAGAHEQCGAALFATLAQDTAGNLYVVSASKSETAGVQSSPYSVFLWHSTDGAKTWSKASKVSAGGSNAFPWITAGDPGRLDITYYHATETSEGGKYTFDSLVHGSFTVEMAQSLNALTGRPTFSHTTVSEHPVKYGPICTSGLGCTISGGDRSLGDYLQVGRDASGAATVAYVDDTSNAYSTGAGPTGQVAATGPVEVSRQIGGPSLFLAHPQVSAASAGPQRPMDSVTDPRDDTFYSANGSKTAAGSNLDLTAASIKDDGAGGVIITMKVTSLENLTVSPVAGGSTGEWITRFTTFNGGKTPGNGHILYAGMESVLGRAPTFFAGDTRRASKFMTYEQEHKIQGSYTAAGLITLHVPAADLAEVPTATTLAERTLYSATAFTATAAGPLAGQPAGLFNLTDATAPFNHLVRAAAGAAAGRSGVQALAETGAVVVDAARSTLASTVLANTGLGGLLPATGLAALTVVAVRVRRRRA